MCSRSDGTNPRALGRNLRALEVNSRSLGVNPKATRGLSKVHVKLLGRAAREAIREMRETPGFIGELASQQAPCVAL